MKQLMMRGVALILICGILTAGLVACGGKSGETDATTTAEPDATTAEQKTEENAQPGDDTVVLKLDGDAVTKAEYYYYLMKVKESYDHGFDDFWTVNPEVKERVADGALAYVRQNHAITKACETAGIAVSDSENAKIESDTKLEIEDYGGQESFDDALASNYMNEDLYRYFSRIEVLKSKLKAAWLADGSIKKDDAAIKEVINSDEYILCKHILLTVTTDGKAASQLEKINEIAASLAAGADFDEQMKQFSEDTLTYDGNLFCRGVWMDRQYEDIAFALAVGQTSGVVKTIYGYVILKRIDKSGFDTETNFAELKTEYQSAAYEMLLRARADGMTVSYADAFSKLNAFS